MLLSTGYSYPNMGRLFLRIFVGIMLLQFGLRQIADFSLTKDIFPAVLGMDSEMSLIVMVSIEIVFSLLPPFLAMLVAEIYLRTHELSASSLIPWQQQNYLPVMFMGIYFFILLVGPGKISIDYFLSLHFIHSDNQSENELEEV